MYLDSLTSCLIGKHACANFLLAKPSFNARRTFLKYFDDKVIKSRSFHDFLRRQFNCASLMLRHDKTIRL